MKKIGQYIYLLLLLIFIFYSTLPVQGQELVWATYYSENGYAKAIAIDDTGNVYITGTTTEKNLATPGAHQEKPSSTYLAKFSKAGKRIWCTYYAGNGSSNGLTVDRQGNIILTGNAAPSSNINDDRIVTTPGAYQEKFASPPNTSFNQDAFIAKFSNSGKLIWATLYGGRKQDFGVSVVTDALGNIFLAGNTQSDTGFVTPGAHQEKYLNPQTGYLAKFSPEGKRLWGTYYGGNSWNYIKSITLDPSGNIFITGGIWSDPYDKGLFVTPGAHQSVYPKPGGGTAYIAKFDSNGKRIWGTYYGGGINDEGYSIAIDKNYNVYVSGIAISPSGISSPGAYQEEFGGVQDAFLVKLDSSGKRIWGTYYGGSKLDGAAKIALDSAGNIIMSAGSNSPDNIATPGTYKNTLTGDCETCGDVCIAKFSSNGKRLWGTYYGGIGLDSPTGGIAVDNTGRIYISGFTYSADGIATPGSFSDSLAGESSTFITVFKDTITIKDTTNKDTSTTVILQAQAQGNHLRIFPNPATNLLTIETTNAINKPIIITDITGRQIMQVKSTNETKLNLDISALSKGLYFVSINQTTSKFIKE